MSRTLSPIVMEHFMHPRNSRSLDRPSGEGWSGSQQTSRYMRVQVCVDDGHVTEASFATYGCAPAIAAGSFLTDWTLGRTVAEALQTRADWLRQQLGGLPTARAYCADLAVDALHAAVRLATKEEGGSA